MDLINLNSNFNGKYIILGNISRNDTNCIINIKECKKTYKISKLDNNYNVFTTYLIPKYKIINFIDEYLYFTVDCFLLFNSLKDIEFYKINRLIKNEILKEINENH